MKHLCTESGFTDKTAAFLQLVVFFERSLGVCVCVCVCARARTRGGEGGGVGRGCWRMVLEYHFCPISSWYLGVKFSFTHDQSTTL